MVAWDVLQDFGRGGKKACIGGHRSGSYLLLEACSPLSVPMTLGPRSSQTGFGGVEFRWSDGSESPTARVEERSRSNAGLDKSCVRCGGNIAEGPDDMIESDSWRVSKGHEGACTFAHRTRSRARFGEGTADGRSTVLRRNVERSATVDGGDAGRCGHSMGKRIDLIRRARDLCRGAPSALIERSDNRSSGLPGPT
jgi:hypothetical protein